MNNEKWTRDHILKNILSSHFSFFKIDPDDFDLVSWFAVISFQEFRHVDIEIWSVDDKILFHISYF